MSSEKSTPQETQPKKKLTREEKQAAHVQRITRTTVACIAGLVSGVLSFFLAGTPDALGIQPGVSIGILLLAVAIAVQRYVFPFLGAGSPPLTTKDWFFQGFMTFSLWFISWTVLLSAPVPV